MNQRRRFPVVGLVGLLTCVAISAVARAQFPPPEVTDEHKVLKRDVGVWDAEMKLWMTGPDEEPMVSKGTERNRMMGDLWLLSTFTADLGGQPFTGHGQFGYDVNKKKFVATWVDSMTTHISLGEGSYDKSTDEMTMVMTGFDPSTGKEAKSKSVTKYVDRNTRQFTMYMQDPSGGDKWVKSMEISYKRRPGAGKKKQMP